MLDFTASSTDEDGSRLSLRTPPGVEAAPGVHRVVAIRRDVVVDNGCEELFRRHFGSRPDAFHAIRLDVARQIAIGETAVLSKATAVLFGTHTSHGVASAEAIEQLRTLQPHVGIYVIAARLSDIARVMPTLAVAGVDEAFVLETRSDEKDFEQTLRSRLAAPAPEAELRLLWKWFRESPERPLVMHCIRNGFRLDDWSVRSNVFAACRKTLQNRVAVVGLPSPGMIARCGRVLHVQELERRGVQPTSLIAELLGFPSASAMQRARRRLRKSLMSRGRHSLVFASLLR